MNCTFTEQTARPVKWSGLYVHHNGSLRGQVRSRYTARSHICKPQSQCWRQL